MIIREIEPVSCGKLLGALYAVLGVILGIIFAAVSMVGAGEDLPGPIGAVGIILFPILYGVGGFIAGLISAFIYNIVAAMVGGIEIRVDTGHQGGYDSGYQE